MGIRGIGVTAVFVMAASALGASPDLHFFRTKGRLRIVGPSCSDVESRVASLREWREQMGEGPGQARLIKSKAPGCTYDIQEAAPAFVADETGKGTRFNGPNCHGTALTMAGITESSTYVQQPEITFWLESPLCRALDASEPARPGDLVQVRWRKENGAIEEIHSFTYVSEQLAFSKNGNHHARTFTLEDPHEIARGYGIDRPECERVAGSQNTCSAWANYYRCASPASMIDETATSPAVQSARESVRGARCQLSAMAYGQVPLERPVLDQLEATLKALRADARTQIAAVDARPPPRPTGEQADRFLWDSVVQSTHSLQAQVYMLRGDVAGYREQDLAGR